MAAMLVGTWTKGIPRRKVAATKPARSPTTPPPTATMGWRRSALISTSHWYIPWATSRVLLASPAGMMKQWVGMPALSRERWARRP